MPRVAIPSFLNSLLPPKLNWRYPRKPFVKPAERVKWIFMGPSVPPQSWPRAALTPLGADPVPCLKWHHHTFLADSLGETWSGHVLAHL